ncbi:Na(+)/H(+) exchange regulatory cofactor NHE-RF2 isoform X1 [Eublepharis macularius]|uniref:Na(+)/H(+) exchange regulatory cofactor NHE-RF n=1 Tax=Eublepharis macularius TaxID=481883 RepID=A0AA97K4L4_EUBMA|nr:Na(+)/H(+) exchange regulatory cofactor NHE-RF2 isoform X1 [Eublepharis macularius]
MAKEQEAAAASRRPQPRLCAMQKGDNGYGFHLHGEKGKSGQFIRKVEPDSPAEAAGLRAGDRVVEVNGVNVEKETHHQVVQRIKAVEAETRLLVVDKETDEYLRNLRLTCTEEMVHPGTLANPDTSPVKMPTSDNGDVWKPQAELSCRNLKRHKHSLSSESGKKDLNGQAKELCPRLCHLRKGPTGYGFNLHSEKSRPGQFIRSVDPDSPASKAGLRPQDKLVEVNGMNVEGMKHSEVVSHIKSKESEAKLLVVDPETDERFKKLGIVPTEEHVRSGIPQSMSNGSAQTQLNGGSMSSSHSDCQSPEKESEVGEPGKKDPFEESGLDLSPTAAEAKEKVRAKRVNKRAPQMDWNKKREIFSNF